MVETMYDRKAPWNGIGTNVQEAANSAEALRLSGLDWKVISQPVYDADRRDIEGYKANVRETDGRVLGIVKNRYQVVQNDEAFAFTDELIGGDVRYETAGSLNGGRRIWILAQLPATKIAGDETVPYLCFSNSHDGSTKIMACMTPVRVICQNTLNLAFRKAERKWATRHTRKVSENILEARRTLELAGEYMETLGKYADQMANTRVTDEQIAKILDELFPSDPDADSKRKMENAKKMKDEFMTAYYMTDLRPFFGTAWALINAASDVATHVKPIRNTANYRENNWGRVMDGHAMIDRTVELVNAL